MRFWTFLFFLSLINLAFTCTRIPPGDKDSGWQKLLIDSDLSNFTKRNGSAEYFVEDGTIVGVSQSNTPNTFLCTNQEYDDFILEFEVWADTSLNSGVQFRSLSDADIMDGRVHGYQVEIESSPRKWAGGIYDEGRRGWLYPLKDNPKAMQAFQPNEWNHYRVEAVGNEITTWVNKVQCTHLIDDATASGFIGLQVHGIDKEWQENKQVKWRNLRIKTTNLKEALWQKSKSVAIIDKTKSE